MYYVKWFPLFLREDCVAAEYEEMSSFMRHSKVGQNIHYCPIIFYLILFFSTLYYPSLYNPALSYPILSYAILPHLILFYPTLSYVKCLYDITLVSFQCQHLLLPFSFLTHPLKFYIELHF